MNRGLSVSLIALVSRVLLYVFLPTLLVDIALVRIRSGNLLLILIRIGGGGAFVAPVLGGYGRLTLRHDILLRDG